MALWLTQMGVSAVPLIIQNIQNLAIDFVVLYKDSKSINLLTKNWHAYYYFAGQFSRSSKLVSWTYQFWETQFVDEMHLVLEAVLPCVEAQMVDMGS